jgi:hypothetical protein
MKVIKMSKNQVLSDYKDAMALVQKIDDDDYRAAAVESLITVRVRRELGFDHPSGDLAMRLRREAKAA